MLEQPTTHDLARLLLRQLYETSDGGFRSLRLIANSAKAKAALEFATDHNWVVVEEDHEVRLTEIGKAVVKRSLS